MADVNKVILIGRLTRDPESRTFSNGGKVAKFGFAVGSRRKNQQTGQWEDGETMFIDCEAFNRGDFGHLADRCEQSLRKGMQVYLEGRLKLETWDDKTSGQKRSKHALVVDNMQFLESRQQGSEGGYQGRPTSGVTSAPRGPAAYSGGDDMGDAPGGGGGNDSEIPF
jgi:single-strand DNA-binding protein